MKIELPFKISTNKIYEGQHYRTRMKHKTNMMLACIGMKQWSKYTEEVDIRFDFYFKSHPLDSDNCSYMGKLITDCMVRYGVLIDDRVKYVRDVTYRSQKGKSDYVEINISLTNSEKKDTVNH